jgi:hypothetical protein
LMDETGAWQLELDISERRMGHLQRAQQDGSDPLPVEFVMASDPTRTFRAEVREVATRSELDPQTGSVVRVVAVPEPHPELSRRIGADVQARIHCGRRSLAYVLFGDVVEFVQRHFWF